MSGLFDRSGRPRRSPRQLAPQLEKAISPAAARRVGALAVHAKADGLSRSGPVRRLTGKRSGGVAMPIRPRSFSRDWAVVGTSRSSRKPTRFEDFVCLAPADVQTGGCSRSPPRSVQVRLLSANVYRPALSH